MTKIYDFTPLRRKPNKALDKAVHEYNEAILVLEDKRVRLTCIARKWAATDTKAKKALAQVTDTIAF